MPAGEVPCVRERLHQLWHHKEEEGRSGFPSGDLCFLLYHQVNPTAKAGVAKEAALHEASQDLCLERN